MFGKLKDKLKSWTKSFAKEESEKEEVIEEVPKEKTPEKETSPLKKETKKPTKDEGKTLEIPTKFEVGTQKVEPDLEKIKELSEELEAETKKIQELKEKIEHPEKEVKETPKPSQVPKEETPKTSQPPRTEETKETLAKGDIKKEGFLKRITSKVSKVEISEKDFEVYSEELEMILLENNVALEVAEKIIKKLKDEIVGKTFLKKEVEEQIKESLRDIIEEILLDPFEISKKVEESSPYIILFCGINGTGKTTTIAKVAKNLQEKGKTCVLAAGDTFRSASIEQIKKHADALNIKLISHDYGSDPAAVAFDAVKYAKKNKIDVVLIDTAGRMHSEKNLLKELEKIAKVASPNLKIFVGEAITGNDSIEQVRSFDWAIGLDAIILTKADTDEKGGTALSVGHITKKPILYLGTGQEYKDLTPFNKQKFIEELGL